MKTKFDPTPRSPWGCPSGEKSDHYTYAKHRRTLIRMPRLFSMNKAISGQDPQNVTHPTGIDGR